MKKLLIIGVTVLSLMLFAGTAYATEGSSQTVVFPFICEVPAAKMLPFSPEHLDMVFTIANVTGIGTNVNVIVRNFRSQGVYLESLHLTPFDVARESCLAEVNKMFPGNRSGMIQTIGSKQYYVGYIEYDVADPAAGASLIGWGEIETLRELIVGNFKHLKLLTWLYTDAGFNGVPDFYVPVNAATTDPNGVIETNQILMPRFNIANSDPDTYNWWIIMTPSDEENSSPCTRGILGRLCDENENCGGTETVIPLPYQVNVLNVADWLPFPLFPPATFPKAGFGSLHAILSGSCGNAGNEQYLGWSYQHTLGSFGLETALIFPMHRMIHGN